MSDRMEQSKQERKGAAAKNDRKKSVPSGGCSQCGHVNPPDARFCEECGAPIGGLVCHKCGALMPADGDLCEACGAWLKGGECSFCGAPLDETDAFCAECGNPTGGIQCPSCGTVSFYDYCPNCHAELTEQIGEMVSALQQSPQHKAFFDAKQRFSETNAEISKLEEELSAMQLGGPERGPIDESQRAAEAAILEDLKGLNQRRRERRADTPGGHTPAPEKPPVTRTPPPKPVVRPSGPDPAVIEARKKKLAELKAEQAHLESTIKNPPAMPPDLSSPQEIRRYYMAVKPPTVQGWLCNAFQALHEDPMHCTKPGDGGRWIS